MPQARFDGVLAKIQAALSWARTNGIVNRRVSPDTLVFQQGSGRALVSFEPSGEPADDQRTMRELSAAMHGATPQRAARPADEPAVIVVKRKGMGFRARVFTPFVVLAGIVVAGVIVA